MQEQKPNHAGSRRYLLLLNFLLCLQILRALPSFPGTAWKLATNSRRRTKVVPQTPSNIVKIKAMETIHRLQDCKLQDLMFFYLFFLATFPLSQMQFCCCIQHFLKCTKGVKTNLESNDHQGKESKQEEKPTLMFHKKQGRLPTTTWNVTSKQEMPDIYIWTLC